MKILGLDSSGQAATVALADDRRIVAEYTVNNGMTHSQTLLPMLEEIRQKVNLDLQTVDAIAVAAGPGSFTGLRIGAATAKGLGLALNKPLIEIPTLEGLACNVWGTGGLICPMMDARRQQVYTAVFRFEKDEPVQVLPQCAVPVEDIIRFLNEQNEPVCLLGDGTLSFREILETEITVPVRFAPAHLNEQRAASLAVRAFAYARRGQFVTAAEHRPEYLRVSQAERERAARLARNDCVTT